MISVSNFGLTKIEVKFSSDYEYFTKYQLERSAEATSGYTQIAEIPAETIAYQTYIDSLINASIHYTYRIRGVVDTLPGPYSATMSHTLSINPPVNILAWSFNDHEIGMSWHMSGAITKNKTNSRDGYEFGTSVERKINTGSFEEIARLESSITSFTDSTLSVNTDYTYRLRTYLNQSYSSYSVESTLQTQLVNVPTQLTATPISDQQIELSWQDNCSFETGYRIERKEGSEDYVQVGQVEENIVEFVDEGLLLLISYTYRIQAFTDYNVSGYSNEAGSSTFFPAPFNLTAEAISDQNIVLEWEYEIPIDTNVIWVKDKDNNYKKVAWNNSRFQQGFSISRREEAGPFEEIGTTEADVLTFTDQDLLLGVNYEYIVRAFTDLNYSNGSNTVEEQTFFPAPDDLIGTSSNDDTIELTWSDNCTFEDTYHIERSIDWSMYEEIAVLDANTTYFTDTGLEYGPQHFYRVRAGTSLNYSEYSIIDTTVTYFPSPTGLTAEPTSYESVELNWIDNCDFEDGYSVEMYAPNGYYEIAFTTSNTCNIIGLDYGSIYTFRVRAKHGANYSYYSSEIDCDIVLPAPTDLDVTPINDQTMYLTWIAISSFEEGFSLERGINSSNFEEVAIISPEENEYYDYELNYGTTYTYRIRTFAGSNYSQYSNYATSSTTFPPPSNLESILISDTRVDLYWEDNCSFEDGFSIERRDAGSSFEEIATVSENVLSYSDETVAYGLEYTYRVRVFTNMNFSGVTNETSQLVEIAAPTDLTANALTSTIIIGWNDNSEIEENFEIERMSAGNDFELIATIAANTETYIDADVINLETYFYRVRAVTTNNQSEYSNIANATVVGE